MVETGTNYDRKTVATCDYIYYYISISVRVGGLGSYYTNGISFLQNLS